MRDYKELYRESKDKDLVSMLIWMVYSEVNDLWGYIKQYNPHILSAYTPEDLNCIPNKNLVEKKC